MSRRQTRQLLAVHEVVQHAHDHPSAEQVCDRVRKLLPRISLGTVYRNLQKLAAERLINVVQLPNRTTRYDGVVDSHDHFMCIRCGVVCDLQPNEPGVDCAHLEEAGFAVHGHALTFHGLCPSCSSPKDRRRALASAAPQA